ncbi:hypothetical protein MYX07_00520 [Patescibacteria group bacterium AH-259-L07]|nr:hypothetical protein [Patescibacteria group bacterium AH-259-L07]
MAKAKSKTKLPSTQKYLDISEIRNDCVVLTNGSLCGIVLTSSINFALKSEDEQKGVISGYVQFLNSLDFPMQIIIHNRPFNIKPYLAQIEQLKKAQTNDLLKDQMGEYSDFIKELVGMGEIMSRRFYIVVPYNPLGDKKRGFFSRLSDVFSAARVVKIKTERFEKYREALFKRVDTVRSGLSTIGVSAAPLDTQSLIEFFYTIYNPAESEMQKMTEMKNLRVQQ